MPLSAGTKLGPYPPPLASSFGGRARWGPTRRIPGTAVLDLPVGWTADGGSIYFTRVNGPKTVLSKVEIATGKRTIVREIEASDPAGVEGILHVFPTPDARSYAYSYIRILSTLFEVEGVR